MIHTTELAQRHQTTFSNGSHASTADVPREKGGQGEGFGPHELLEAALATCMSMTARMYADKQEWNVSAVHCTVKLDRSIVGQVTFHYAISAEGSLTNTQREQLAEAVRRCPVAKTLSGTILFQPEAS